MLDTTMRFSHYYHHGSVKVCLTGDDFENMYGHMLGERHMSGGMMNHMNDEHHQGDEHFGGFDMNNKKKRHSIKYIS